MKKTIEHGKVWIIAAFISFASFIYLQADQQEQEQQKLTTLTEQEILDQQEDAEFPVLDADIVKGITLVVVKFFFVN